MARTTSKCGEPPLLFFFLILSWRRVSYFAAIFARTFSFVFSLYIACSCIFMALLMCTSSSSGCHRWWKAFAFSRYSFEASMFFLVMIRLELIYMLSGYLYAPASYSSSFFFVFLSFASFKFYSASLGTVYLSLTFNLSGESFSLIIRPSSVIWTECTFKFSRRGMVSSLWLVNGLLLSDMLLE